MNSQYQEQVMHLFQRGVEQYQAQQFDAASQLWQKALEFCQERSDLASEVELLEIIGSVYYDNDNYLQAIEFYNQGLELLPEIQEQQLRCKILRKLGDAYYCVQNSAKSVEVYQEVLTLLRELEEDQEEAITLNKLGLALFELKQYNRAIQHYQESLKIAQEIKDQYIEAWVLDNLGGACAALHNYNQAIEFYQQSFVIVRQLDDLQEQIWLLEDLGDTFTSTGQYSSAIETYRQGLDAVIALESDPEYEHFAHTRRGWLLSKLGIAYDALGNTEAASDLYQQSLAIAKTLPNNELKAQVLGNLGSTLLSAGLSDLALPYQHEFLATAQLLQSPQLEAQALANLGDVYYYVGNYDQSIAYTQQSLDIAQSTSNQSVEKHAWETLGNIYNDLEEYEQAIACYQKSLAISQHCHDQEEQGRILSNLGGVYFKAKEFTIAETTLKQALRIWDRLWIELGQQDAYKVSRLDIQAKTYRHLQQVLVAQDDLHTALEVAEKSRTRALTELLFAQMSSQLLTQVIPKHLTVKHIQQIAQEQKITIVEYSIIYHSLTGYGQPKLHGSELFIWVIQPAGQITFRSVDITWLKQQSTPLGDFVKLARESIGVRGRDAVAIETDTTDNNECRLKQLYQMLIQPVEDLLPLDPESQIVFIPQGPLFLVPFAALKDEQGQYLIEKHTIRYVPSIQVLAITQTLETVLQNNHLEHETAFTDKTAIVVGNPTMPILPFSSHCLKPLPGAEQEAKIISSILQVEPLLGQQATKPTVLRQLANASVIHFATHAILDEFSSEAELSMICQTCATPVEAKLSRQESAMLDRLRIPGAIALAPSDESDGWLTAQEIAELKLRAELVVLSACDTGQGRLTGDGVIGLSRAFVGSGVPSIIVSLWAVPDEPTAILMAEFYRALKQGQSKSQALRQAMLTLKQNYPFNPRAWAAFSLIGAGR